MCSVPGTHADSPREKRRKSCASHELILTRRLGKIGVTVSRASLRISRLKRDRVRALSSCTHTHTHTHTLRSRAIDYVDRMRIIKLEARGKTFLLAGNRYRHLIASFSVSFPYVIRKVGFPNENQPSSRPDCVSRVYEGRFVKSA